VGKVGSALVRLLVATGARVSITDRNPDAVRAMVDEFGLPTVPFETSHTLECDIWSPCAMGGVLNHETIPTLRCRAIVGAANNQLGEPSDAKALGELGIVYAPDYIVNAGGIINVADGLTGYRHDRAYEAIANIQNTTATVLSIAATEGITTLEAADRMAERRIHAISSLALHGATGEGEGK
jgi:leucine dehydrogenase